MNYKEIKSYEDACKVLGVQPISENAVAAFPAEDRKSMLAYHKLTIIARAINGGWKPDWNNRSQYKYYPVFYYEIAGLSYASASRGFVCACVLRLSALLYSGVALRHETATENTPQPPRHYWRLGYNRTKNKFSHERK